jgi:hypothetical protein
VKNRIIVIVLIVIGGIFLSPLFCLAEDDTFIGSMSFKEEIARQENSAVSEVISLDDKRKNEIKEMQKFITLFMLGGIASGVIHEVSHIVVARAEGVRLDFIDDGGQLSFRPSTKSKYRNIAIAGFGAQALGQELIFATDTINAFTVGYTAFYTINNIAYVIADSVCEGGYGDFKFMRENGMNTDVAKAILLAHTAFTIYRLYKNPKFMPIIGMNKNEFMVGMTFEF